jgi:hypothetical protein
MPPWPTRPRMAGCGASSRSITTPPRPGDPWLAALEPILRRLQGPFRRALTRRRTRDLLPPRLGTPIHLLALHRVACLARHQDSPSYVGEPPCNGCADRVIRTLKEQVIWTRRFATIEELTEAVRAFVELYNRAWLIERHGHRRRAKPTRRGHRGGRRHDRRGFGADRLANEALRRSDELVHRGFRRSARPRPSRRCTTRSTIAQTRSECVQGIGTGSTEASLEDDPAADGAREWTTGRASGWRAIRDVLALAGIRRLRERHDGGAALPDLSAKVRVDPVAERSG